MDAFHDEDVLLMKLHHIAFKVLAAFLEVKARNLDLLAFKKIVQLTSEKVQIHRSECLEIVFAVLVARSLFALHEIVVQLDDTRVHAQDTALEGKPFRCGCLSAA